MRRVRVLAAVLGLCLVGSACDDPGGVVSAPPSFTKASLDTFADCDEALDHLKAEALKRVTPWGLPGNNWPGGPEIFIDDVLPIPEGVPAETFRTTTTFRQVVGTTPIVVGGDLPITSGDDSADDSFSGTNVQVAGVDEPDVVKTNGSTLYVVRGRQLDVVDIRGAEPQPLGSFQLDNWGAQILLEGTRVVVIDSGWDQILQVPSNDIGIRPAPEGSLRTHVTELDVSRPDAISVTRKASVEGSLVGARLVDGHVRVVVEHTPHDLPFVSPSGRDMSVAQATNRQVIENSTIDDWLPLGTVKIGRQTTTRSAVDCSEIHAPNEFSGFGQAVVFNLDLNDRSATIEASAVLAQASMLYSTATSLYLATNEWVDHSSVTRPSVGVTTIPFGPTPAPFDVIDETYTTALHAFATPADGTVDYLGSGRVDGHAHNQFSLDEHKGALRVVTTVGAPWSGGSESMVSVLRLLGDELKVMGSVGGLGKGEQVKSVRFAGDRGYVVTFRQIDPLYTLDLTDDRNPRVLGELKIPGFSSYLHPIEGNRLIGVGSDATLDGRVNGLLVSLFDVSNPAAPKQVSSVTVSDARSNVSFDHHAFLYWPETNLLVVPVNSWETNYTGAMGLRVGAASLTEIGLVQHLDPSDRYARPEPIARSLVAQGSLITTSNLGIKVSDLNDMSDRNWLGLPVASY